MSADTNGDNENQAIETQEINGVFVAQNAPKNAQKTRAKNKSRKNTKKPAKKLTKESVNRALKEAKEPLNPVLKRRGRPRKITPEEFIAEAVEGLIEDGPPPAREVPLSVMERTLGVGFGESEEELPDAPVIPRQQLPHNVKEFIVIMNACNRAPRDVVKSVKETFGIDIRPGLVEHYDPMKAAGNNLHFKLKQLYGEMKREYEAVIRRVGIANQDFRLSLLHEMAIEAKEQGAKKVASHLIEQAAREVGGMNNKIEKPSDDNRALLSRLLGCDPSDLPPIPKVGAVALPAAPVLSDTSEAVNVASASPQLEVKE